MQKFTRSLLLAGAAFGLAACGDDVSITEPTPPPAAVVTGVTVAPSQVTINIAEKVIMTAQVAVSAGTGTPNTTVAWSSANASIASVNATSGEVTGVAAGTTTIRATAGGLTGAAGVTVREAPLQVPATVSIQSVTQGATNTPVNLANVAGQIEVTMNINAGSQTLDSVRVRVGNVTGAVQTFSGAPSAPVTLSINTAAYTINADSSATVRFTNGDKVVRAEVFVKGTGAATPAASNTVTFTLNNLDTFHARWTNPATSALDANGLRWYKGSVTANVIPVMYSGNTVTSVNMGFGACTAANDTAAPFVQTFTCATAEAAGQAPIVNSSVRADGNSGPTGVLGTFANALQLAAAGGAIRLDNVAPTTPSLVINPNNREANWVNDAVSFVALNAGTAATANNMINGAAPSVDGGVGVVTYKAKAGADSAATVAAADISSPTALAASLVNGYCLFVFAEDALGNRTAVPAQGCTYNVGTNPNGTRIGVDRAAPTITYSNVASVLTADERINAATVGQEFQVSVVDTGTVGNSGMSTGLTAGTGPVRVSVTARTASATSCVVGTGASCAQTATGTTLVSTLPLVTTTTVAAQTTDAYYTFNATAYDAAGNTTAISTTRTIVADDTAPALTTALFNTPLTGNTATFNANASDNLDLRDVSYTMTYAGGLAGPIAYPAVVLNTFNAATLVNSNVAAGITVNGFMRQVENATNADTTTALAVGGAFKPTSLSGNVRDQAGNTSGAVATAIPGASVTTGTSYTAAAAANLVRAWNITNAATNVSNGASTTPANALSVTLNADLFGPTATFNSPFTRVDFYRFDGTNLVLIGSATTPTTTDNGAQFGRRHRYSFTWTPGASIAAGAIPIYAVGVNANGDALVTPVNNNITVTNP